jgi:hypothetical protein
MLLQRQQRQLRRRRDRRHRQARYLIVRGHHLKDGFDSDEFIAALAR